MEFSIYSTVLLFAFFGSGSNVLGHQCDDDIQAQLEYAYSTERKEQLIEAIQCVPEDRYTPAVDRLVEYWLTAQDGSKASILKDIEVRLAIAHQIAMLHFNEVRSIPGISDIEEFVQGIVVSKEGVYDLDRIASAIVILSRFSSCENAKIISDRMLRVNEQAMLFRVGIHMLRSMCTECAHEELLRLKSHIGDEVTLRWIDKAISERSINWANCEK